MSTDPSRIAATGRRAVTAVFFINGLTLASYLVRLPSLKAEHHLGNGELGLIGTLFGAAALVTMQSVGPLVARFGSVRIIRPALLVMPILLICIGRSRDVAELAGSLMLLGAVHGMLDVAMNAHAVAVERLYRRPIMSGCHAAWSVSAVVASLLGVALTRASIGPSTHFLWIGVAGFVAAVAVGPFLMPPSVDQRTDRQPRTRGRRPDWRSGWTRALVILGATGTLLMICDGAAYAWSGIFLHDNRGATLSTAAVAVTAYTACQTLGRLVGDRLTLRYGATTVFRVSALIGVAGFTVAVAVPVVPISIAGFAILGIGAANLLPLTFSAVGHAGGRGSGAATSLSRFTTFTYAGILFGPALVGWVAQGIGLTWTLATLIPLLGAVALLRLPTTARSGSNEPGDPVAESVVAATV